MANYLPQQKELYNRMYQNVAPDSQTARLAAGDPSAFEQMEAPAMRQFQDLQGQTASRFSGMGMGARKGSGFANEMNQATSDFAQDLQSKRQALSRQAIQDMMSMSNDLLSYEFKKPKKKKWWEKLIEGGGGLVGAGIGALTGGPMGMAIGANVGNAFSSSFSGQPQQQNWSGIADLPRSWKNNSNQLASGG
jgi:hypothetical protein